MGAEMFRAWELERRCGMTGLIGHGAGVHFSSRARRVRVGEVGGGWGCDCDLFGRLV